jgi:hypothetical protein
MIFMTYKLVIYNYKDNMGLIQTQVVFIGVPIVQQFIH